MFGKELVLQYKVYFVLQKQIINKLPLYKALKQKNKLKYIARFKNFNV